MLTIQGKGHKYCDGVTRRSFLRIGGLAMGGLTLPQLLSAESASGTGGSPKSIIMIFLSGGAPHQDMYDLKMDAPVEVRGRHVLGRDLPILRGVGAEFEQGLVVELAHRARS